MLHTQTLDTPGDTSWFVHDRFGLFIHWGLYTLAARHEWVQSKEGVDAATYRRRYFDRFDPDLYDPDAWAAAAAGAGMKYFCVGTKHHEGFCLWDSKHTDFKVTNTPYGRDVMRPTVEAFNARGLRTCFYHSLLDWSHPDYVVDYVSHPLRGELPPVQGLSREGMLHQAGATGPVSGGGGAKGGKDINAGRDMARYTQYLHDQVRELLTDFGDVHALWFDFSFVNNHNHPRDDFRFNKGREAWQSEELYAMIRQLQPNTILTNRLDLDEPMGGGDILTPEQTTPRKWMTAEHEGKRIPVVWEACQTFSGSWGYHRDEHHWRSPRQLITTLIECVSKGGNLLLNVGPTGRGEFDHRALSRLEAIGRWMHHHDRSIYGCTQAPEEFPTPEHCSLTYHPERKRLYLHLFNWPYKFIHLDGRAFAERVEYAQLLHDASEVRMGMDEWHMKQFGGDEPMTTLRLPLMEPEGVEVPVIEMFLK